MTRLTWDPYVRPHEVGIDQGVLYFQGEAYPWNGLVGLDEESEVPASPRYLDGRIYNSSLRSANFSGTIHALTYPEVLEQTGLKLPSNRIFGLCYRVLTESKYRLHLIYNLRFAPLQASRKQEETSTFDWEFTTRPVNVPGYHRTSHIVVEADVAHAWTMEALEEILYGDASYSARLPLPAEILQVFEDNSILQIIDHGDGNWTAIGPDANITMLDADTFQIDYSTAIYLDPDTYTIHSL